MRALVILLLVASTCLATLCASAQTVEYIHADSLGTPIAVTNAVGAVIERSEYAPYGDLLSRPDSDGPGYTGHVQDASTGLTYMQQRYYDPSLAIFLSTDPMSAYNGATFRLNRYRYANGNPYSYFDPNGEDAIWMVNKADKSVTVVIPVKFVGSGATASNISALEARASNLKIDSGPISLKVLSTENPIKGRLNTMDFSPGFDHSTCPGAGECVTGLGESNGHINSAAPQSVDALLHDVLHFAGIKDRYTVPSGDESKENSQRGSMPDPGFENNIMGTRSGQELTQAQLGEAVKYSKRCTDDGSGKCK